MRFVSRFAPSAATAGLGLPTGAGAPAVRRVGEHSLRRPIMLSEFNYGEFQKKLLQQVRIPAMSPRHSEMMSPGLTI